MHMENLEDIWYNSHPDNPWLAWSISFYFFYLCTHQTLELGFCLSSLCSSFRYAYHLQGVQFSCVLCMK